MIATVAWLSHELHHSDLCCLLTENAYFPPYINWSFVLLTNVCLVLEDDSPTKKNRLTSFWGKRDDRDIGSHSLEDSAFHMASEQGILAWVSHCVSDNSYIP